MPAALLIPKLSRFQNEHPDIPFHLETRSEPPETRHMDVDVAILLGTGNWPDLVAERLAPETVVAGGQPRALKGRTISEPGDLRSSTCSMPSPRLNDWERWFRIMGVTDINAYRGMRFDSSNLAYQAGGQSAWCRHGRTSTYVQARDRARAIDGCCSHATHNGAFVLPGVSAGQKSDDPRVMAFARMASERVFMCRRSCGGIATGRLTSSLHRSPLLLQGQAFRLSR